MAASPGLVLGLGMDLQFSCRPWAQVVTLPPCITTSPQSLTLVQVNQFPGWALSTMAGYMLNYNGLL